jgi:hypothetical protein
MPFRLEDADRVMHQLMQDHINRMYRDAERAKWLASMEDNMRRGSFPQVFNVGPPQWMPLEHEEPAREPREPIPPIPGTDEWL